MYNILFLDQLIIQLIRFYENFDRVSSDPATAYFAIVAVFIVSISLVYSTVQEGRGFCQFADGQQYQGLFKQGCREGRGSIIFPEVQTFKLINNFEFKSDCFHVIQGAVYEGTQDILQSIFNCSLLLGRFRDDKLDGMGTVKVK